MPADQDRDEVYFGKTSDEVPVEERGSPEVVTQDCNNLKHSAPPEGAGNTAALSSESSEGQKLKPNSTVKIRRLWQASQHRREERCLWHNLRLGREGVAAPRRQRQP
jgi:hypothetical protein